MKNDKSNTIFEIAFLVHKIVGSSESKIPKRMTQDMIMFVLLTNYSFRGKGKKR